MMSAVMAFGCGDEESTTNVRVMHLSPDAPAIDAFLDSDRVVAGLEFTLGSDAIPAEEGVFEVAIAPAGLGIDSAVLTLGEQRLEDGKSYTAFAFGDLASLQLSLIEDGTQGLASNQVRVRVIHTAFGVGNVNVYVEPEDGAQQTIVTDLRYGNSTSPVDIAPEAFVAGIDVDGDGESDLLYDIPALEPGTSVNVFASRSVNGDVSLVAQLPGDAIAILPSKLPTPDIQRLRVVHLSPDAPAVEPLLDGESRSEFGQIVFPTGTNYASLLAMETTLDVTVDGTISSSVLSADLEFERGASYTAVAINRVSSIGALFFRDDASGLAAGDIRVRAIHGAPDVGQVDIYAVAGDGALTTLLSNVDTGTAAEPLDVVAGAYTLGVDVDNDEKPDLYFELPELSAGTLANVYVTQDNAGSVFMVAQLPDGSITRIDPAQSTVRVLHLSRNAPNVDVYVGGGLAVSNLPFKSQSSTLSVVSGSYETAVAAAGAHISTAVINAQLTFLPSKSYTVVAYGDLATISALVLEDEASGLAASDIRLPITHCAPGVTRGDIYELLNGSSFGAQLVDDFGFGETQTPPDLPAGTYIVGFDANATGVIDVTFDLPLLAPQTFARAYVIQDANNTVELLVQLQDTIIVVPRN
jgi:hypothetical protein